MLILENSLAILEKEKEREAKEQAILEKENAIKELNQLKFLVNKMGIDIKELNL